MKNVKSNVLPARNKKTVIIVNLLYFPLSFKKQIILCKNYKTLSRTLTNCAENTSTKQYLQISKVFKIQNIEYCLKRNINNVIEE